MNEEMLQLIYSKLDTQASFKDFRKDFESDEDLQQLGYSMLDTDASFDDFKKDVFGQTVAPETQEQPEQIPDTTKGVQAEVDGGGSASTSADTDSSSELQSSDSEPNWRKLYPDMYAEADKKLERQKKEKEQRKQDYQQELEDSGVNYDDPDYFLKKNNQELFKKKQQLEDNFDMSNPEVIQELEQVDKQIQELRTPKSTRKKAKENLEQIDKERTEIEKEVYKKADVLGISHEEAMEQSTEYQEVLNRWKRTDEVIKEENRVLKKATNDMTASEQFLNVLLPEDWEGDVEQLSLTEDIEEEILLDLDNKPELKKQLAFGSKDRTFTSLEARERLITVAKKRVFKRKAENINNEWNQLSDKLSSVDYVENPMKFKQLQKRKDELLNQWNNLVYNVGYDEVNNKFNNAFKKTTEKEEYREALKDNKTLDVLSTLVNGLGKVALDGTVGFAGAIGSAGDIFTNQDNYSAFDAVGDLGHELSNHQLLPASEQHSGTLINDDGSFNLSTYSVAKTAAEGLPFTVALIAEARKGNPKKIYKKLAKVFKKTKKGSKELAQALELSEAAYRYTLSDNLKEAKELGLKGGKAQLLAQGMSVGTGLSQLVMPDTKFFGTAVGKNIVKGFSKNLKSATTKQAVNKAFVNFMSNTAKEVGEEELDGAISEVLKLSMADNYQFELGTMKYHKELITQTLIVNSLVQGVGLPSNIKATKDEMYKNLSSEYDSVIESINNMIKGSNNQQFRDVLEQSKVFIGDVKEAIEKSPENVTAEQIDLLIEKKKLVNEMNSKDDAFKEGYKQRLDELNKKIANVKPNKNEAKKDTPYTKKDFSEKLNKGKWGMLTAENPNAKPLSKGENKKRNEKAKTWLEGKGYAPKEIKGIYEGNKENSFFVEGLTRDDAVEFAREFNQESVATSDGFVYQDGSFYSRKEGSEVGGKYDDMYSTIETAEGSLDFKVGYDFSQKKAPEIAPENSSNYANMTEDTEGNFVFYHVGGKGYKAVKPGTGASPVTSTEERSALNKVGGLAMFFTSPTQTDRQSASGSKYEVKVPKDKVYDANTDPLNLVEEAKERHDKENPGKPFDNNSQIAYITKIAGEKGYDMVVSEWKNGQTRAQTTKELKPTDVQETDGNTITKEFGSKREDNRSKGFEPVIPKTKSEKLQEVYDKINKERNKDNNYDSLYHLRHESDKYTQEDISEMINDSDISQELKDEYNQALESKEETRKSKKTNEQNQQESETQATKTATETTGEAAQETAGRSDTENVQESEELEALEKELDDEFSKNDQVDENVKKVEKSLSEISPDTKITLHNTEEEYHQAIGEEDNSAGAYDPKTKTIHINPVRADNSTAFHEAFHAILNEKLGDNVNEIGGIVDQMVDLLRGNVDVNTPIADGYSKGEVNEEALANLFGELAANWTSLKPKSRNLVKRLLDKLSKLLGFNKKITEDEVYDLLNILSAKIRFGEKIQERDLKIFKGGKFRPNPKQGIKKQKYGSFDIDYIEDKLFEQYSKDGFIKSVQDPSVFAGMKAVATSPDNLFTGSLKLGGDTIFQGGGGIYFVLKYSDVWASSKIATNQMVRALNKARKENGGKTHLILTGGSKKKLFSSVSGVRGSLSIVETLLRKGLVKKTDFKNAFTEAIKSEGGFIEMRGSTDNLINNLENYFNNKSVTTFKKRGNYIKKAISNLAKNENVINNSDRIIKFLGGAPGKKISVNDGKTVRGLTDLIVEILSEPLTRGLKTGDVYAAVEVTSDVYTEKGQHESYPYHIKTTDGSKPKLILFKNAEKGEQTLVTNSGKDYKVAQASSIGVEYKHPIKKQKKPKSSSKDLQKLVNYSRGKGYKDKVIKQALIKRGFTEAEIDQALNANPFTGKSEKNQVNNLSSRLREKMKKIKSSERSKKRAEKIAKSRTAEFMDSWEGAVNVVMDTMNLTGNPAQSMYEGMESLRKSDWYNSVSAEAKRKAERMFNEEVGRMMPKDETAGSFMETVKATKNKLVDVVSQKLIDKYTGLRNVVKENFNIYNDDVNFSQAEINMHGKAAEDLTKFEKRIEDVMKRATKQGFNPQQISDYLYAKHAEERNRHIKENIDPENEFGSGMTPAAIDKILNKTYNQEEIAKLDAIAEEFYDMIQETRDMMLDFGMITEETHMNLTEYYSNYVPLKGFDNQDIEGSNSISGKAIDVKGNRLKRAAGRSTKADNIIASIIQQRSSAVINARKNEVLMTLKNLAEQNPNNEVVKLYRKDDLPTTTKVNSDGNKVTTPIDPNTKNGFVGVMVDGEQMYLRFANPEFARMLEGAGVEKADIVTKTLRGLNRYLSATLTTLNPEFVISNFARDIQTAVMNVSAEADINKNLKGKNLATSVVRDTRRAISAIYKNERHGKNNTEFEKHYEEFKANGAKTGWANQNKTDDIQKNLNRLHKINSSKGLTIGSFKRGAKSALKLVEDVNTSVENGVRLSAYINARKAGLTAPQAAALAKELTVNFNKSGEFGTIANSLYLFFNAAVQGNVRFAKAMLTLKEVTNPDGTTSKKLNRAQKIAMGLSVFASMLTFLNQGISDDDEDGLSFYSKIPDYEKERNLIFMNPVTGKDYFKIPLPYGYNIFHNMGMIATEVSTGDRSVGDGLGFMTSSTLGAFSPISIGQGSDAANTVVSALTPTVAKPIADLARNENYFGNQIYNEDFPFADKTSDASKGRKSTPTAFKEVAKFLNDVTGGNTYEEGLVDVAPESLYYWFKFGIGGTGQFLTRTAETTSDAIKSSQGQDVDIETRKIPFVRKLAGEPNKYVNQNMYFDRFDQLTRRQNAIMEKLESRDYNSDDKREMDDVSSVLGKYESINKSLRKIRKYKKQVENNIVDPVRRTNKIKELDEEYYKLIKEANRTFNEKLGRNYFE